MAHSYQIRQNNGHGQKIVEDEPNERGLGISHKELTPKLTGGEAVRLSALLDGSCTSYPDGL